MLLVAPLVFLATTVSKGAGIWTGEPLWSFFLWTREGALSAGVGGALVGGLLGAVIGIKAGPPPWTRRR